MNTNMHVLDDALVEPVLADAVVDPLLQIKVAYAGSNSDKLFNEISPYFYVERFGELSLFDKKLHELQFLDLPDVLVLELDDEGHSFSLIEKVRKEPALKGLIIIAIALTENAAHKTKALQLKVHDYYQYPFNLFDLKNRIQFLVKFRIVKPFAEDEKLTTKLENLKYKLPLSKRIFDLVLAAVSLFLLSPLFVIIGILIRLESKGNVIYTSKRVGTGYKLFNFYKFRSMHVNADQFLDDLSDNNQYANSSADKPVYIKIADDPRITKVGRLLRNTSLDELPQLYNILIGDMSFVGNRPLPLYEAQLLTSNEWSMRFLGPAGLTGLWQISKRGKKTMSELERKELDNFYAKQHSFRLDIKILLNTFPAILQQEKV